MAKDRRVFSRKACPACGRSMRSEQIRGDHREFWGCSGYPDHCQNTENSEGYV
ncbi:topoisomerase DNA-binding C4 zinc finger domain-containing protein (plasmid) [Bradyrhizobium sp. 155]|nr:topoisomerase DNA-binding C4 zinc finger domain-containing protein [Bradyrhizobium sp. 155]